MEWKGEEKNGGGEEGKGEWSVRGRGGKGGDDGEGERMVEKGC